MNNSLIEIKIKLFAIYQEIFAKEELKIQVPARTTVIQVLEILLNEKPQLQPWLKLTRFGVNLKFVDGSTILQDGDEVVFITTFSGG